jgi:TolA-binding protein
MSKKIAYGVIVSILALIVAGCAQQSAPEQEFMVYEPAGDIQVSESVAEEERAPAPSHSGAADYTIERLIIRNASLSLTVADTETALDEINEMVDELEGYVVEANLYQYQEGLQAHVTLRIPADSLDVALERVRGLATEVRSESISGHDMTEEYVDLQSRLRHLEATEERLLEFLDEAEDTEAALAVYEQLRQIEGEIEQIKGRMQYLEQSAAMATVNLDITPDELAQPIQIGGWHPEGTLRNAFEALIHVLQFLVDAAIVILVLVIPILVVIAVPLVVLFLIVRTIVRRRRARRTSTAD